MKNVLVTGASGFVGGAVLRTLQSYNVNLRLVLRNATTKQEHPNAEIIQTDDVFAMSGEWWEETCEDIDVVFHLAWYVEPGKYLTSSLNLNCLSGTLELARGAALAKVRKFVGIGTCFEYDLTSGYLSTNTPLAPESLYAATKASTFMVLSQFLPANNVEFLWARLFYLFGKGEDPRRLVPYLHQQLQAGRPAELSSGKQVRDFLDVDVASRILVSDAFGEKEGASNISSGVGITVRALVEDIADQYNRHDLLRFGARPDNLTDPPCVIGLRNA